MSARRIADRLALGPTLSFEFFPPKTEAGAEQLSATVDALATIHPDFVSVTYGAGGSTRDATRHWVERLVATLSCPTMPHLTCVGHTRPEIDRLLEGYGSAGVSNVLALAGDPPESGPDTGDFRFAAELVEVLRERGDWCVGVAAFPEGHPRSSSLIEDRHHLAAKLEVADFGITQFFYRVDDYVRMMEDLHALGCTTPVLPGVMPLMNPTAVRRFAEMNRAWFPEDVAAQVESLEGRDRLLLVSELAADLCTKLVAAGAPGIHLYSMNRADVCLAILERLDGLMERPVPPG